MREYVDKYLKNRHKIDGNRCYLKDDDPSGRICHLFGIESTDSIILNWLEVLIGETFIMEFPNGTVKYFKNRQLHREDGPAVVWCDGEEIWHLNGQSVSQATVKKLMDKTT